MVAFRNSLGQRRNLSYLWSLKMTAFLEKLGFEKKHTYKEKYLQKKFGLDLFNERL